MHPIRRRRLINLILMILGIGTAIAMALYALQQNINLFFSPTQVIQGEAPKTHDFHIGGIVKPGSVRFMEKDKTVQFDIADKKNVIHVVYHGILPDLFRPGQSIVVQGQLNAAQIFIADQVLAKHGAQYKPRGK